MFCIKVAVCKVKLLLKNLYFTPSLWTKARSSDWHILFLLIFPHKGWTNNSMKLLETSIFPSNLQVTMWKISLPNLTTFSNPLIGKSGGEGKREKREKKLSPGTKDLNFYLHFLISIKIKTVYKIWFRLCDNFWQDMKKPNKMSSPFHSLTRLL